MTAAAAAAGGTPFHDLARYVAIPRVTALRLSPDGSWLRQAREDAGVTAILHESVLLRYWDHDLGPAQLRLFAVDTAAPPGRSHGAQRARRAGRTA